MADFWYDEAAGAWLAEMESTAYAFGLAGRRDGAAPPALGRAAAARGAGRPARRRPAGPMPRHEAQLSMARERPDEYVPWGGLRFDEPSLKAEFARRHQERRMARRRPPDHQAGAGQHAGGRPRRHRPTRCGSPSPTASTTASTCSTAGPRCGTVPTSTGPASTGRRRARARADQAGPLGELVAAATRRLAAALPARRLERGDAARADHAHPGQGGTREPPRHHQPSAPPLVHAGPGRHRHRGRR